MITLLSADPEKQIRINGHLLAKESQVARERYEANGESFEGVTIDLSKYTSMAVSAIVHWMRTGRLPDVSNRRRYTLGKMATETAEVILVAMALEMDNIPQMVAVEMYALRALAHYQVTTLHWKRERRKARKARRRRASSKTKDPDYVPGDKLLW